MGVTHVGVRGPGAGTGEPLEWQVQEERGLQEVTLGFKKAGTRGAGSGAGGCDDCPGVDGGKCGGQTPGAGSQRPFHAGRRERRSSENFAPELSISIGAVEAPSGVMPGVRSQVSPSAAAAGRGLTWDLPALPQRTGSRGIASSGEVGGNLRLRRAGWGGSL